MVVVVVVVGIHDRLSSGTETPKGRLDSITYLRMLDLVVMQSVSCQHFTRR